MGFIIADLEGTTLTQEEKELLQHPSVVGVIFFARNYKNKDQLKALTRAISLVNDQLFILVDQEGGRVQRFYEGFTALPSMRYWGECYETDSIQTKKRLQEIIRRMANELKAVGVHATLGPVLDIDHGVSEIIGERSFSGITQNVIELGEVVIDALHESGMPTTGKHFPGHGGVVVDSHEALPVDSRDEKIILEIDLLPFNHLSHKLDAVMPSHIVYETFDEKPACFSRYWLQDILRKRLNFLGAIISDDLNMKGATVMGDYVDRTSEALAAGCDIIILCNNRPGFISVLDELGHDHNFASEQRVEAFRRKIR